MEPILIMRRMRWSWHDYVSAPEWLIDLILLEMREEAKAAKEEEFQRRARGGK